jgi:hypothetical protein
VYLPPDLVTKILSLEWGISTRAMIMTLLEIPLLMRIRSPSFIVVRLSLFRFMAASYHCLVQQANILLGPANLLDNFHTLG